MSSRDQVDRNPDVGSAILRQYLSFTR
jgi:hypothetical protein